MKKDKMMPPKLLSSYPKELKVKHGKSCSIIIIDNSEQRFGLDTKYSIAQSGVSVGYGGSIKLMVLPKAEGQDLISFGQNKADEYFLSFGGLYCIGSDTKQTEVAQKGTIQKPGLPNTKPHTLCCPLVSPALRLSLPMAAINGHPSAAFDERDCSSSKKKEQTLNHNFATKEVAFGSFALGGDDVAQMTCYQKS